MLRYDKETLSYSMMFSWAKVCGFYGSLILPTKYAISSIRSYSFMLRQLDGGFDGLCFYYYEMESRFGLRASWLRLCSVMFIVFIIYLSLLINVNVRIRNERNNYIKVFKVFNYINFIFQTLHVAFFFLEKSEVLTEVKNISTSELGKNLNIFDTRACLLPM